MQNAARRNHNVKHAENETWHETNKRKIFYVWSWNGLFSVDLVCKWLYLVWKMCTRLELDTNHRESSLFNIRIIAAWIASTFADLFNDPKIMCSMVIFMSFVIDVNGKRTEDNWSYLISLCTHQSELKWIRDCWLVVSSWINRSF